jgi:hypothetical protein
MESAVVILRYFPRASLMRLREWKRNLGYNSEEQKVIRTGYLPITNQTRYQRANPSIELKLKSLYGCKNNATDKQNKLIPTF